MTHGESNHIVVTAYVYSIGDIPWSFLYMPTSIGIAETLNNDDPNDPW